jgi:hypothetical protein
VCKTRRRKANHLHPARHALLNQAFQLPFPAREHHTKRLAAEPVIKEQEKT